MRFCEVFLTGIISPTSLPYSVGAEAAGRRNDGSSQEGRYPKPRRSVRFAIRLNAAAMEGYAAGSIGASFNLNDRARVSVNYGTECRSRRVEPIVPLSRRAKGEMVSTRTAAGGSGFCRRQTAVRGLLG